MADGITWAVVELGAGIISCCLPTMMPIVQFASGFLSRQIDRCIDIRPRRTHPNTKSRCEQQPPDFNVSNEPTAMDYLEMLDGPPYSEWRIQPGSIDEENRLGSFYQDDKRDNGAPIGRLNGSSIRVKKEVEIRTRSG